MRKTMRGAIDGFMQLRQLLMKGKTTVMLLALFAILLSYLSPLADSARANGVTVNPLEPILLVLNSGQSFPSPFFYIYAFFVIMLSDMPVLSGNFRYRIVRIGRRTWAFGQIACIFAFCVLYTAIVCLFSSIPFLSLTGDAQKWSRMIQSIPYTDIAQANGLDVKLGPEIWKVYTPADAAAYSILLLFAYLLVSALFISALHAFAPKLRPIAVAILMTVYMFDYIRIYNLPNVSAKYMPAVLARLTTINNGYNAFAPSMRYALTVWAALLIVFTLGVFYTSRRARFDKLIDKE